MFFLEILVQNGSPLSTLSEGSQPYACYKISAHVSDSGMNEMQPTHVYTLQQEPECSSHCRMNRNLKESPGHYPRRAFWLGITSTQLSETRFCALPSSEFWNQRKITLLPHSVRCIFYRSAISESSPRAQFASIGDKIRKEHRIAQRRSISQSIGWLPIEFRPLSLLDDSLVIHKVHRFCGSTGLHSRSVTHSLTYTITVFQTPSFPLCKMKTSMPSPKIVL